MRAGALVVDNLFRALARAGKATPMARPERHHVTIERNFAYGPLPEHRFDVYRPQRSSPPWPTVLYIHGGGFRILSKDTHWMLGLAFARQGYLVLNIDYRLAPQHPYPAAIEDSTAAFRYLVDHAAGLGADLSRLIFAGESAGANLVTSLALTTAYRRDEPHARAVFDTGITPTAVVPACGIFQVSDTARFHRRKPVPSWLRDRLTEVEDSYLRGANGHNLDLADPVVTFERGEKPHRQLPAFFLPVGTRDVLLDDTRRLAAALRKLGAPVEDRYYPGGVHAFHAMVFRREARQCWADTFQFLHKHVR
jgi:acetyl esterase